MRDTALFLDVASGPLSGDGYEAPVPARAFVGEVGADPGHLRVAVSTVMPSGDVAHPACVEVADLAARLLESLGHSVEEATPSYPLDALQSVMRVVMSVPLAADIDDRLAARGRGLRDDDLEPFTRVLYEMAKTATGTDMVRALQDLERAGHALGPFFDRYDLLVTPTMPAVPHALGVLDTTDVDAMYRTAGTVSAFTAVWNVTGQPAISLPLGYSAEGLPIGVQLVARFGREDVLIRVSSQVEAAQPWSVAPVWPPRT
jgi:amidase